MQNKSKNKNFRQLLFNKISIWIIKNQRQMNTSSMYLQHFESNYWTGTTKT